MTAVRASPLLVLSLVLAGCGRAPRATVLYVTDAHEIAPVVDRHGDRGGVARLKSVVDARKASDPGALLVFGGDLAGGTLFGGVFRGEPMVEALGRAGAGLATFGQHDFDFGAAHAKALVDRSAFPWITSNLVDRDGRPFASLPTRKVVRVGGLSVGFLGLTDDFGTTTQEGTVFQADLVAAAAREAHALRREGAGAIVALTQAGFEANRRLLLEVPGIDAILTEEESETVSVVRWVGGRPVAAPCGNLGSVVELVLERKGGRVAASVATWPVDASVAPDPDLAREEAKWTGLLSERLAAPIGVLAEPLDDAGSRERETPLGSLVADAFREATGAEVALVSGSSLRAPLPSGPLTRRNAMSVLPFGNRVVVVEMTGSAVGAALEKGLASVGRRTGSLLQVSGLAVVVDLAAPAGERVLEVRVGGSPLRADDLYRVAVSSHLASGGDGHAEIAAGRRFAAGEGEPLDVEALAAHLSRLSAAAPATAPAGGRIVFRTRR
ncbi:MAG: 5'-nucleotidase C-terminal domain-containing protein [Thermoanaerobaculia bacterium]|nr:5'-nucleotidase C-terminal domain-containing protein [Thermoanaerobaculia bacterium]